MKWRETILYVNYYGKTLNTGIFTWNYIHYSNKLHLPLSLWILHLNIKKVFVLFSLELSFFVVMVLMSFMFIPMLWKSRLFVWNFPFLKCKKERYIFTGFHYYVRVYDCVLNVPFMSISIYSILVVVSSCSYRVNRKKLYRKGLRVWFMDSTKT